LRKLKEQIVAVKLEKNLTKQEILTLYLNTVPWGYNSFGIKSAAKTYFNKLPKDLNIEESALLIGMLKGSSLYNPVKHPERAIERRNTVIDQMVKNFKISAL
jgi:penicillin-binding protein 1A